MALGGTSKAAVALVVLVTVSAAHAQEDEAKKAEKFLGVAFRLRHDGNYDQAAAAFDAAIDVLPEGPERRQARIEAHELAVIEGRYDRAARLGHGWDLDRECVALARDKRGELALKLAREKNNALVEARVLHLLGRDKEALAAFEKAGREGSLDRGQLLLALDRPADAAKAFEDAGDTLRRALALEQLKDSAAVATFEAARVEDQTRLGTLLAREKDARARQKAAAPGLAQERARFALAEVLDQLLDISERLSLELERTGDKPKAGDFAQGAVDAARAERETLTATGDRYGAALALARGLEAREKRLAERVKRLKG